MGLILRVLDLCSPHSIIGPVAEALAEANGLDPVDPSYFFTELRHKQWLDKMETRQVGHRGSL